MERFIRILLCFAFVFSTFYLLQAASPQIGEVVFTHDTEVTLDSQNRTVLPLPLDKLQGTKLRVTAEIKAENVAKPPQPWNGVKCMLHSKTSSGDQWQQKNDLHGTFDWQTVEYTALIDRDTTSAEMILGIENTTGKAWIKNIAVRVIGIERIRPAKPANVSSPYKGHDISRLRGVMIQPRSFEEEDLNVLADWGVNHVRWQLLWGGFPNGPADKATPEEYHAWIEQECQKLDRMLPLCEKAGVHVVIDLHSPPGGRLENADMKMFLEKKYQDTFLEVWEKMARRYKGNKAVWAYDLMNEPCEGIIPHGEKDAPVDWRTLAIAATKKIRAIDAERAIILEPAPWGSPDSLDWFEPIDATNIVYSVHMYLPHRFTHQGVHDSDSLGTTYPGQCDGKYWDKAQLEAALEPVTDYQKDYGVHIYLGEFSVIRWAPGESGKNYLTDCVDIFEQNGWDWAYHAFREWDGWSLEHGPDRNNRKPSEKPTDRLLLLQSWFEKNR